MIPPILHRVVPHQRPAEYDRWWEGWRTLHPGWKMRTWYDSAPEEEFETGDLFRLATSPSQIADFIRYEVLWREGGIYLDWDVEPVRPLNDLLNLGCFFAREIPEDDDTRPITVGAAVIGAARHHPALRDCLECLRELSYPCLSDVSGPGLASKVALERADVTLLAAGTFYPYRYTEAVPKNAAVEHPEAYGVHHWAHSWRDSTLETRAR